MKSEHWHVGAVLAGVALVLGIAMTSDVEAGPGLTPRQLAEIVQISSAEISPDGQQIAYLRRVPRPLFSNNDGREWQELHVLDRASGRSRPFVIGEVNVHDIAWLGDGSAIAFLAQRGEQTSTSLYLIPVNGGEARLVLGLDEDIRAFSFTPDGTKVAVIAAEPEDAGDKELAEQGFDQVVFEEDWRPFRVFVVGIGEQAAPRPLPLEGSAFQVRFDPTGTELAVALAPRPLVDDRYMFQRVRIVDPATGEVLKRIANPGKLGELVWSPDGARLAMISAADLHDPATSSLLVAERKGGDWQNLTEGFKGEIKAVAWESNDRLLLLADEGTTANLYHTSILGRGLVGIHTFVDGVVLSSLSVAADGVTIAARGSAASHPPELYAGVVGEPLQRMTTSNPWLDEVALANQELITYPARDGLEIEAVLLHPLDEQPETRYPLVVIVHGGPESHVRNAWVTSYSRPGQILAARGFVVLYPNYRGSTGRGVAFSKLGQADAAGKEFDDLVDGVDYLVQQGLVDPSRVGITGGSYGGYATAWCATRFSERFAAGVMFVGISDKISKAGTTDIPMEEKLVHARSLPHEDYEFFWQRSPIAHVAGAHTPLLIAGGTDDARVHPSQAMQMYRALKAVGGVPVRLVRYPGEGHGNRKAAARYDLCLRLLRWMEHYLTGEGGEPPGYRLDYTAPMWGWAEDASPGTP